MGCCGDREKQEYLRKEQRWEYINLDDFKSTSCLAPFAYFWLWTMLAVSISVYCVDTFTCVNLIAFDKWSGQVEPAIPFNIARWIFAGCIILSAVLLIYRWGRAIRVMRQGGVAKSYLDPLAVRIQSIRMGSTGRGWKRFLVFAELTKSRKGADYVALFSYFSFEAWLRIVFAEGPRQVINAITLYSVMKAELIPGGDHTHSADDGTSSFVQFWRNVGILADQDKLQAAILIGMLWTLVIWIISAISLALSVILYLIFLWHHIPSHEGGLTNYCRNKINRRMERIVNAKVKTALKKENELQSREEARAARDGLSIRKQPTLPSVSLDGDTPPTLSRQTTMTTLPEYESRPASLGNGGDVVPPLPTSFIDGRPLPQRHMTNASDASWSSYNSSAPLMSQQAEFGQSPIDRAQTPGSVRSAPFPARPMPSRSATAFSQFSEQPFTPGPRPGTANSTRNGPGSFPMEPLGRPGTSMSSASRMRNPSMENDDSFRPLPTGTTPYPDDANGSYFPPVPATGRSSPAFGPPRRAQTFQDQPPRSFTPQQGPIDRSITSSVPPPRTFSPQGPPTNRPFMPTNHPAMKPFNQGGPPPSRAFTPSAPPPDRNFSASVPPAQRSFSPAPPQSSVVRPEPSSVRSYTPTGSVPDRTVTTNTPTSYQAFSPISDPPPPLTRAETSSSIASSTYTPFKPNAISPSIAESDRQETRPQPYRSFSRPLGPGQRNSNEHRDSSGAVSDIINHY